MIDLSKQMQIHTDIDSEIPGDCWRTALACLLEIPMADVPHFLHLYPDHPHDYESNIRWWTESKAYVQMTRPDYVLECFTPVFPFWRINTDSAVKVSPYVILSGQSPRGDWAHAVIADAITGDTVHDPYPGGGGLLSNENIFALIPKEYTHV